jgi:hypothetical protein
MKGNRYWKTSIKKEEQMWSKILTCSEALQFKDMPTRKQNACFGNKILRITIILIGAI